MRDMHLTMMEQEEYLGVMRLQLDDKEEETIDVLKPILLSRAAPGASIYTDCWKAYP